MTQFAIFYEMSDLQAIADNLQSSVLGGQLRQRIKPYWDGGLSGWQTAPLGHSPTDTSCPDCHILVINNPNGNLAGFRQLLRDVAATQANNPSAQYLIALANDMGGSDGAWEPWPPV